MPPMVFFIGLGGIIAVIVAFVILELARPWPTWEARIKKQRAEEKKAKRHEELDKRMEEAAARDAEADAEKDSCC